MATAKIHQRTSVATSCTPHLRRTSGTAASGSAPSAIAFSRASFSSRMRRARTLLDVTSPSTAAAGAACRSRQRERPEQPQFRQDWRRTRRRLRRRRHPGRGPRPPPSHALRARPACGGRGSWPASSARPWPRRRLREQRRPSALPRLRPWRRTRRAPRQPRLQGRSPRRWLSRGLPSRRACASRGASSRRAGHPPPRRRRARSGGSGAARTAAFGLAFRMAALSPSAMRSSWAWRCFRATALEAPRGDFLRPGPGHRGGDVVLRATEHQEALAAARVSSSMSMWRSRRSYDDVLVARPRCCPSRSPRTGRPRRRCCSACSARSRSRTSRRPCDGCWCPRRTSGCRASPRSCSRPGSCARRRCSRCRTARRGRSPR